MYPFVLPGTSCELCLKITNLGMQQTKATFLPILQFLTQLFWTYNREIRFYVQRNEKSPINWDFSTCRRPDLNRYGIAPEGF